MRIAIMLLAASWLAGCAGAGSPEVAVAPGRYAEAFTIARQEIRRIGFTLERVDARGGVITSAPMPSAGVATPWVRAESTIGDEIESFMHRDQRVVRAEFKPKDGGAEHESDEPLGPGVDRRSWDGELTLRINASVEALHRPNLRLTAAGVRLASVSGGGDGVDGPVPQRMTVTRVMDDARLAARIAERIRRRLGEEGDPE